VKLQGADDDRAAPGDSEGEAPMPGYVLYGNPGAGSAAVEAAMAEAGIAYDFRVLDRKAGEHLGAEYSRINPRQQVPALVLADGSVVTEVPAILNRIADAHPESRLAPPPGTSARAQHDRWLGFLHANVYEGVLRVYYAARYTTDPAGAAGVEAAARAYVDRNFALFDAALGIGPFFAGASLTAVDLFAWMLATWVDRAALARACPKVGRLVAAVEARPRLADVVARNG
jgi:glutathione S-transferase